MDDTLSQAKVIKTPFNSETIKIETGVTLA